MTHLKRNQPLLSVVIPTRNRQEYAISAINSILSNISAPDFELVVQDNSDSRNLQDYIHNRIDNSRLRYNYTPTPLSIVDNFAAGVRLASGKYLCFIGDDDGVNPEIIEATRWVDMSGIDALKPAVSVAYLWPKSGVPSALFTKAAPSGVLTIRPFSGKITRVDPEMEMRKVVRNGGRYLETDIPRLYHGIVKSEVLNKVREKTGGFFGGLSPDIFAAIAVANFAENAVSLDYPLTIPGTCKLSGAGASHRGEHVGHLEDAPHFEYRGAYRWAEIIPRFYSVETIWAETTIAALKALERDDLLRYFDLPLLAADCIAAHPKYKSIILHDMYKSFRITNKNQSVGTSQFCYSLLTGPGWRVFRRAVNRAQIILTGNKVTSVSGVKSIAEATSILSERLRANGKRFADLVV